MNDNLGFDFDFPTFETKGVSREGGGRLDVLAACVSVGSLRLMPPKKKGWTQVRCGKGWSLEY